MRSFIPRVRGNHTRRPACRIKRPSVPPAARGSAPAAAQEAAGRRKTWPLRVHARRSCFIADPLGFRPLPGASPLVGPPPAALVHLLARWRPSVERRHGERSRETRDRSPCRRTHWRPRVADYPSPRRRKRATLRQAPRRQSRHVACWSLRPKTEDLRSSLLSRPRGSGGLENKVLLFMD